MPHPKSKESKEEFISRFMASIEAKKSYPDTAQRLAVANSVWEEKKTKETKTRFCANFQLKEDGDQNHMLVATSHPDRVGDILSDTCLNQIADKINSTQSVGDQKGAYRMISLFHDWVYKDDPSLQPAGFITGKAEVIELPDGHKGVKVPYEVNKYLDTEFEGQHYDADRVRYELDKGQIGGLSIEWKTAPEYNKPIVLDGETYNYVEQLTDYAGQGFARARLIANPHAVPIKEIIKKINEADNMAEEENKQDPVPEADKKVEGVKKEENPAPVADEKKEAVSEEEPKKEEVEKKEIGLKEEDVKKIVAQALKELNIKSKVVKKTNEDIRMETKEIPISIKEMNKAMSGDRIDSFQFKEATSNYFAENPNIDMQLKSTGIPLKTTLKVKCVGNKLRIAGQLQVKATLDTTTNAGAYTESIVEFADLFIPGLIETFNNQINLFGALRKVDHLMGGNTFGWKIKTDQASSLSVDPDDPAIVFNPVNKLKLRTPIKEYRVGVSVSDYTLHHARATMGDLLMLEAEARMGDLMRDINNDLFTEQVDTAGNKILGLEAVADSAGNTSIYGKTRSAANRLSPASAATTYVEVGGALTTALMRAGFTFVENEGTLRRDLRIVTNPAIRDDLFELEDANQRYNDRRPELGFDGSISYDGVPILVDSSCQSDALFIYDDSSYYIVISRPPQMIGLAKVGAADSAYISIYLAAVYEQPRRIHMLNTLS